MNGAIDKLSTDNVNSIRQVGAVHRCIVIGEAQ